ncbi:hypothetical protein BKA80DRAFT_70589 [Phyllosticta citrichinensis]
MLSGSCRLIMRTLQKQHHSLPPRNLQACNLPHASTIAHASTGRLLQIARLLHAQGLANHHLQHRHVQTRLASEQMTTSADCSDLETAPSTTAARETLTHASNTKHQTRWAAAEAPVS